MSGSDIAVSGMPSAVAEVEEAAEAEASPPPLASALTISLAEEGGASIFVDGAEVSGASVGETCGERRTRQ